MIAVVKPSIGKEEMDAVNAVLASGMLAQGPKVKELEEAFAKYCHVPYAIAVNNGTSALHAALYAAGIKPGDEVITVPFTFVATANSILMQGATPIFVDIEKETYTLDAKKVRSKITKKTKALLPVNLYGQMCDYAELKAIAKEHNLQLIEDAAQSIGATWNGQPSGSIGDLATFSLYATKNMMCGEGGMITTHNADFAERVRRFRHHGQSEQTRYQYFDLGYNYRLTDIQAAIAVEQLKKVEGFNAKRKANAKRLTETLSRCRGIVTPKVMEYGTHVFHQYTILVTEEFPLTRDELMDALKQQGIASAIFYPKPLHLHPHFAKLGYSEGDFPVSESIAKQVLSLPIHPLLTDADLQAISMAFLSISEKMKD